MTKTKTKMMGGAVEKLERPRLREDILMKPSVHLEVQSLAVKILLIW